MLETGLVRWSFGGGAYVLLPTSDTNKAGIPGGGYAERIIYPSSAASGWAGRNRAENEGGGNIDWRGPGGNVLTWWGPAARYWDGYWPSIFEGAGTSPGFVGQVFGDGTWQKQRTAAGFTGIVESGIWLNGKRVLEADDSPFLSDVIHNPQGSSNERMLGACLRNISGQYWLYVVVQNSSHGAGAWLLRAPVDVSAAKFTAAVEAVAKLTKAPFATFHFNRSGTAARGVGTDDNELVVLQLSTDTGAVSVEKSCVIENEYTTTGGFTSSRSEHFVGTYEGVDEYSTRTDACSYSYSSTSTRKFIIAADYVADAPVDMIATLTLTGSMTGSGSSQLWLEDSGPRRDHPLHDLVMWPKNQYKLTGNWTTTHKFDGWLEWTGPYAKTVHMIDWTDTYTGSDFGSHIFNVGDDKAVAIYPVLMSTGGYILADRMLYWYESDGVQMPAYYTPLDVCLLDDPITAADLHMAAMLPEPTVFSASEHGDMRSLLYADMRYGIALTLDRDVRTDYTLTAKAGRPNGGYPESCLNFKPVIVADGTTREQLAERSAVTLLAFGKTYTLDEFGPPDTVMPWTNPPYTTGTPYAYRPGVADAHLSKSHNYPAQEWAFGSYEEQRTQFGNYAGVGGVYLPFVEADDFVLTSGAGTLNSISGEYTMLPTTYHRYGLLVSPWQVGAVACDGNTVLVSMATRAYEQHSDFTVRSALLKKNGGASLSTAGLREITGIDADNEGYAPVRVYSRKNLRGDV